MAVFPTSDFPLWCSAPRDADAGWGALLGVHLTPGWSREPGPAGRVIHSAARPHEGQLGAADEPRPPHAWAAG